MRCSITGRAVTRPSAITPRPSTKRGRQWRNQVSTELEEGQYVLSDGPPLPVVLVYTSPIQARHPSSMSPTVTSRGVRQLLHWPTSIPFRPSSLTRNTRKYRMLPQYTQRGPCKSRRTGTLSIFWSFAYWGLSLTGHDESLS